MSNPKPATGALRYPNIVAFVRDTPWQILESKLFEIRDFLAVRAYGDHIEIEIDEGPSRRDATMSGSVAIVPIHGVITPRADLMSEMSGGTSIDRLQASIDSAAADPNVSAIVLDVNSPGGSVQGLAEAAQTIRQARAKKPVVAVANHQAASAAYRLASQATEFVASPSSHVGSIGTIAAHEDISRLEEMAGVKTTLVHAGKFKAELSPFAPLSDEARSHLQETVDKHQQMFEQDVARGRGVPVEKVRTDFGQGRMLLARDAVKAGLVDRVGTMSDVVRSLQKPEPQASGYQLTGSATNGTNISSTVYIDGKQLAERTSAIQELSRAAVEEFEGPIAPKSTPTSDSPWDGPQAKANLDNDKPETYRLAFAWFDSSAPDPDGDGYPDRKGDYKGIHHEVSTDGTVGAANLTACSQVIAELNGGRGGFPIPAGDRQGVWNHVARHLRDAGREPPPLKSIEQTTFEAAESGLFVGRIDSLVAEASILVDDITSLAGYRERQHLSGAKRERLAACTGSLREVADAIQAVLAATDKPTQSDTLLRERLRFERVRASHGGTHK